MSKQEFLKIQTCILKVNIHCDGCKHKVKKILQKIEGVYTAKIESDQGKVTVSGNVDSATLIKKLIKNGKHAELWGAQKANNNNNHNNQIKNLQINNGKGGNKGPGQKGGGNNQPKGSQNLLKMASNSKDQNGKLMKFKFPEDEDMSDDDDDLDCANLSKMKPMMVNGHGGPQMMPNMMNGHPPQLTKPGGNGGNNGGNGGGGGVGSANVPVHEMNHGGGGGGKKGGNGNNNGGKSSGTGGQIKNSDGGGGGGAANSNNLVVNGPKKVGGMNNRPNGMSNMMAMNGGPDVCQVGNMPMGQIGNFQMDRMNNLAAVQCQPASAMNYGAGGGSEHMGGNSYYQQQLAAMMVMSQQRAEGNERFQMMYARPPPAINCMPPHLPYPYPYPPPPGERADQYAMFSDENTSSCSIM